MIQNIKSLLVSTTIGLLLFSPVVLAIPKPDKCPNVAVIQYRGLLTAEKDAGGIAYVVTQFDKYGTSAAWAFGVGKVFATDSTEAVTKATALLPNLSGNPEPEELNPGMWICYYDIGSDQVAFALTMDSDVNLLNLPAIKHKK